MMSRSVRLLAAVSAVFVVQSLLPTPVSAQLGGLGRKLKQAAEGAVEQQLPFTPQPAPEYSDRVLEITPDRLDALLRGFKAEADNAKTAKKEYEDQLKNAAAASAKYDADLAAYNKAAATWATCADAFHANELKASLANADAIEKLIAEFDTEAFEKYVEDLARRGEKLAQRAMNGTVDPATQREWDAYVKEVEIMKKEQDRRVKAMMAGADAEQRRARTENPRLVAACGREPTAPAQPMDATSGPEGVLLRHGSRAASLQGTDPSEEAAFQRYTIMRERVIAWLAEKGRPTRMGFSPDEVTVLQGAADQLKQAEKDLKKAGVSL